MPAAYAGSVADDDKTDAPTPTTWDKHASQVIGGLALLLLAVGTVVYRIVEDWNWVDSFYFSAVALTTVGFGDFTPATDVSKLFTVFYIFSGIALITAYLNELGKRFALRAGHRAARRPDQR